MSTLVRNVKVVDCRRELKADVLIQGGRIAKIAEGISADAKIVDGQGKTLLPSFVDLHAHFRDPGNTEKEDVLSGCKAAVHGGYTMVSLMSNTNPVCSSMDTVHYVLAKAAQANLCDIHQTISVTKDFDGVTVSHMEAIDSKLVRWLSDDGRGVAGTRAMFDAMVTAKHRGMGLMLHEEDAALTGVDSYAAEEVMTFRDVRLGALSGCPTHFCHVSTIDAMKAIIKGKKRCGNLTCEVTPHHLCLNDETKYNVAPPLRSEEHRKYLVQCLKEGHIDAIATDHAPHTPEDKAAGANGITGLDLAFSTCYTYLVKEGHITLRELSRLMSAGPAEILGSACGRIEEKRPANLVLVDLDASYTVTEQHIFSKSKNTPMIGKTLYGEILWTMKEGVFVYEKAH